MEGNKIYGSSPRILSYTTIGSERTPSNITEINRDNAEKDWCSVADGYEPSAVSSEQSSGRVRTVINEIESGRQKYEKGNEPFPEINIFRDPNKMLNITISTIMLLASGKYNIPDEYYMWARLYLKSIKDVNKEIPPNISSILKHMEALRIEGKQKHYSRIEIAKKRSRIPVARGSDVAIRTNCDRGYMSTSKIHSTISDNRNSIDNINEKIQKTEDLTTKPSDINSLVKFSFSRSKIKLRPKYHKIRHFIYSSHLQTITDKLIFGPNTYFLNDFDLARIQPKSEIHPKIPIDRPPSVTTFANQKRHQID